MPQERRFPWGLAIVGGLGLTALIAYWKRDAIKNYLFQSTVNALIPKIKLPGMGQTGRIVNGRMIWK